MKKFALLLLALCLLLALTTAVAEVVDDQVCPVHGANHVFFNVDFSDIKHPTCCEGGYAYRVCDCGERIKEEYPANGHTASQIRVDRVEATCTENGYVKEICIATGNVLSNTVLPAKGHDQIQTHEIEATCCTDGSHEQRCGVCGAVLYNEVLPAYGHDNGVVGAGTSIWVTTVMPTCTTAGEEARKCTRFGTILDTNVLTAIGHNYVVTSYGAPTCTVEGWTESKCINCGEVITVLAKPLGHTAGAWTVITPATCTTAGAQEQRCTVCNEILKTKVIPALGHDWNLVDSLAPACNKEGFEEYVCGRCPEHKIDVLAALEHILTWHTQPATCTAVGYAVEYCELCNTEFQWLTLDVLPHDYKDYVTLAPTCTETGLLDQICDCGDVLATDVVIPALGHDWSEAVYEDPATCTTPYIKYHICQRTDCDAYEKLDESPALGHDYAWTVIVEPTCSAAGTEEGVCTRCDDTITRPVALLPHDYVEVLSPATEIEHGSLLQICNVCGHREKTLLHYNGGAEWVVVTPATCTEDGLEERVTCILDGCNADKETRVIPAAHTPEVVPAVEPTCTSTGLTEGEVCSVCGDILKAQEEVPMLPHTAEEIPAVAATCTEAGLTAGEKCSVCGCITIEQAEVAALGHTEVIEKAVDPTCVATGMTEGSYCSVCGLVLVEKAEVPTVNHKYVCTGSEGERHNEGSKEFFACTVCGDVIANTVSASAKPEILVIEAEENVVTLVVTEELYKEWQEAKVDYVHFVVGNDVVCIPMTAITVDAETTMEFTLQNGELTIFSKTAEVATDLSLEARKLDVVVE